MDTSYYTEKKRVESVNTQSKLASISYLIIDVDGTMTDGGIYYDEHGNEMKKFNTKDAAGFFAAKVCGIKTVIVTGRECEATSRRMREVQADFIIQGVKDKVSFIEKFMKENQISKENIGYVGDDLNDFSPMKRTGFIGCPQDACDEVIGIANYVSSKKGGEGAVRDIICYILKERNQWNQAIQSVYNFGI